MIGWEEQSGCWRDSYRSAAVCPHTDLEAPGHFHCQVEVTQVSGVPFGMYVHSGVTPSVRLESLKLL